MIKKKTLESQHKKTPTIIQDIPQKKKNKHIKSSKSSNNLIQNKPNLKKLEKENKNLNHKNQII